MIEMNAALLSSSKGVFYHYLVGLGLLVMKRVTLAALGQLKLRTEAIHFWSLKPTTSQA